MCNKLHKDQGFKEIPPTGIGFKIFKHIIYTVKQQQIKFFGTMIDGDGYEGENSNGFVYWNYLDIIENQLRHIVDYEAEKLTHSVKEYEIQTYKVNDSVIRIDIKDKK